MASYAELPKFIDGISKSQGLVRCSMGGGQAGSLYTVRYGSFPIRQIDIHRYLETRLSMILLDTFMILERIIFLRVSEFLVWINKYGLSILVEILLLYSTYCAHCSKRTRL